MINIFISGVTGRVGKILLNKIIQEPDLSPLQADLQRSTNKSVGEDLGIYNGTKDTRY